MRGQGLGMTVCWEKLKKMGEEGNGGFVGSLKKEWRKTERGCTEFRD